MNIIYIVPYVPNLIRVRPYNLIRQLAKRGHDLTLVTVWTDEEEREFLAQFERECSKIIATHLPGWRSLINCVLALPTDAPLQTAYSWDSRLARRIGEFALSSNKVGEVDVIHVEHLRGVRYGMYLKTQLERSSAGIPIVWDSVDSISHLFRQTMVKSSSLLSRGLSRFELGRTKSYEACMTDRFDHTLVTSEIDRRSFLSLAKNGNVDSKISVIKNGVDLEYFQHDKSVQRDPTTLVVSGKMSYHANVAMVMSLIEEIMPLVWAERPDVKVMIVGKDPPQQVEAMNAHPNIRVTGTVADVRPYLQQATIAVAPVAYSAGIQNKVLEAMACGTPTIASEQAVSALNMKSGVDLLIAQDPADFAIKILHLLEDNDQLAQLGQAGRDYVEAHHHWGAITDQLEQIYEQSITRKSGSSGKIL